MLSGPVLLGPASVVLLTVHLSACVVPSIDLDGRLLRRRPKSAAAQLAG